MDNENARRDEIYAKPVRAGKRTYFFDVKATKGDDYYITITESKKKFAEDGKFFFEKHKLFLYKEDFQKFADGLNEVIDFIQKEKGVYEGYQGDDSNDSDDKNNNDGTDSNFTDVSFDDLGTK